MNGRVRTAHWGNSLPPYRGCSYYTVISTSGTYSKSTENADSGNKNPWLGIKISSVGMGWILILGSNHMKPGRFFEGEKNCPEKNGQENLGLGQPAAKPQIFFLKV
jgi:hypothetical protein